MVYTQKTINSEHFAKYSTSTIVILVYHFGTITVHCIQKMYEGKVS